MKKISVVNFVRLISNIRYNDKYVLYIIGYDNSKIYTIYI